MLNIGEWLKSPIQDKQWPAKIAIGGVVSAVPILSFCGMGYVVGLLRRVIKKEEGGLPEWSNWGKLFTDGILYWVICFLYMLIPGLISGLGMAMAGGCAVRVAFGAFVIFIAVIVGLAAGFILPMAICQYIATDDFKSAFAWKVMQEKIKSVSKDYGLAYLTAIGLFIAGYIVCFILGLIIIGWILFPFLFFYLSLVFARMFGEIYPSGSSNQQSVVSDQ